MHKNEKNYRYCFVNKKKERNLTRTLTAQSISKVRALKQSRHEIQPKCLEPWRSFQIVPSSPLTDERKLVGGEPVQPISRQFSKMMNAFSDMNVLDDQELDQFRRIVLEPSSNVIKRVSSYEIEFEIDRKENVNISSKLNSSYLRSLFITKARNTELVRSYATTASPQIFISSSVSSQQSSSKNPLVTHANMKWHVDGANDNEKLLTWVYIYFESPEDLSAKTGGGAVLYSRRPDGIVNTYWRNGHQYGKSSDYCVYYPKHNSSYLFSGSHTSHAITPTCGEGKRFAVVLWFKMRQNSFASFAERWALLCCPTAKVVCKHCFRTFASTQTYKRHNRLSCKKKPFNKRLVQQHSH